MNTRTIGMWVFLIGLALAAINGIINLGPWMTQLLIVLAVLSAVLFIREKDFVKFGVSYLAFYAAAASMDDLIFVGEYITKITSGVVRFLGPVVLVAFLLWVIPQYMDTES